MFIGIWPFVVFSTPAQHPRISKEEKQFIELSIQEELSSDVRFSFFKLITLYKIISTHKNDNPVNFPIHFCQALLASFVLFVILYVKSWDI